MTLDYIIHGMRFKIQDNEIFYLEGGGLKDNWVVPNFKLDEFPQYVMQRMIALHYLYKDELARL